LGRHHFRWPRDGQRDQRQPVAMSFSASLCVRPADVDFAPPTSALNDGKRATSIKSPLLNGIDRSKDSVAPRGESHFTYVASAKGIAHLSNKCSLPAFYLTRQGMGLCVRPHRYALAMASGALAAGVLGLH
jgi:hypothetical protein